MGALLVAYRAECGGRTNMLIRLVRAFRTSWVGRKLSGDPRAFLVDVNQITRPPGKSMVICSAQPYYVPGSRAACGLYSAAAGKAGHLKSLIWPASPSFVVRPFRWFFEREVCAVAAKDNSRSWSRSCSTNAPRLRDYL